MVPRIRLIGVCGFLVLGGCEAPKAPRILDVHLVVGEATRVIGTEDGPSPVFGSIDDVLVRGDGSLLVADAVSAQIWHLNEEGEVLGTFGGHGEGPGEFATPRELASLGEDEYVVLDVDRFELTVVRIDGVEQSYVGTIPMPFQAMHLCAWNGEIVVNPFAADFALVRMDRTGSVLASYLPLTDLGASAPTPEARAYVAERTAMGIALCRDSGEVDHIPEWGTVVRGYSSTGREKWSLQLSEHMTLGWEFGESRYPQVSLPPEGWVHHARSARALGDDLLLLQLQAYGEGKGGRMDDPTEVRLLRPSDGAEVRIERTLPNLAVPAGEESWWWSNLPFPRLIQMPFDVVEN